MVKSVAGFLRRLADSLDPPLIANRRAISSARPPEEALQSLKEMSEVRNVLQLWEYQANIYQHAQSPGPFTHRVLHP
jgi:hypothetical protein